MLIREVPPADAPIELLLLADPSRDKVSAYLSQSTCFVGQIGEEIVAACVVQSLEAGVYELMNIAVQTAQQQAGYGSTLLEWVIDTLRERGASRLEVGTGAFGYQLGFYQKYGFRVSHIEHDFFINHYPEPIIENGIQHFDMLRLALSFTKQ